TCVSVCSSDHDWLSGETLFSLFFFTRTAATEIYTLSLHDALPICRPGDEDDPVRALDERVEALERVRGEAELVERQEHAREARLDRKSTRLNSSHVAISYAVFCLEKKNDQAAAGGCGLCSSYAGPR